MGSGVYRSHRSFRVLHAGCAADLMARERPVLRQKNPVALTAHKPWGSAIPGLTAVPRWAVPNPPTAKLATFPVAGDVVDGRKVRDRGNIPNTESIGATLFEYEVLEGVREVPMGAFPGVDGRHYSVWGNKRREELAEEIAHSNEITPLIVVVDDEGPYILEGATRIDALYRLGAKSIPALVVIDEGAAPNPPPHILRLTEAAHAAVKEEIPSAAARAVEAGADPAELKYVGAGGEAIVLRAGTVAYKVSRRRTKKGRLSNEAAALAALAVHGLGPHVYEYDADLDVIVRDHVEGHPGTWGESRKIREAYDEAVRVLAPDGFTAPEFKEDSFIIEDDGRPVMVDVGFVHLTGQRLVDDVRGRDLEAATEWGEGFDAQMDISAAHDQHFISDREALALVKRIGNAEGRAQGLDIIGSRIKYRAAKLATPAPQLVFSPPEGSDPWQLAKMGGINILSHMDFVAGYEVEGALVAALFDSSESGDYDCYAFDIVVEPKSKKKGLGSALMDIGIGNYDEMTEAFPDIKFCLDAVNPIAERMLKQRGFVETGREQGHIFMTRNPPPSEPMARATRRRANPLSDVVFHKTRLDLAADIMDGNRLMTSAAFANESDMVQNRGKLYFLSTMRSILGEYAPNLPAVTFKLDGRKLNQRFLAGPVDYWGPVFGTDEMEDRIFTDLPYVSPASAFIEEIHVGLPLTGGGHGQRPMMPARIEEAERLDQAAKAAGVPIYFYPDEKSFGIHNRRKRMTLAQWERAFKDKGGELDKPTPDLPSFPARPSSAAQFAEIISGLESGDTQGINKAYQSRWESTYSYPGEAARNLRDAVESSKREPGERPELTVIGRAVKRHGGSLETLAEWIIDAIRREKTREREMAANPPPSERMAMGRLRRIFKVYGR